MFKASCWMMKILLYCIMAWGLDGTKINNVPSFINTSPSSNIPQYSTNKYSSRQENTRYNKFAASLLHMQTHDTTSSSLSSSSSSSALPPVPENCHRIVMMRHGESEFNNANVFTGWCDVALTPRGIVEAVEAGQVFASRGLSFRRCYASVLTRSIATAHRALEAAGVAYTPLEYDWRLNERHYGALQGLSKERTAIRLGRDIVMKWRRSYEARPPPMTPEHPHYRIINDDPRYRHLRYQQQQQQQQQQQPIATTAADGDIGIPLGESLEDCQQRVLTAWNDILDEVIAESINSANGNYHSGPPSSSSSDYSLLVAHANTLRALVMHLDDIPAADIESVNIPTAIPFYYDIDLNTKQIHHSPDAATLAKEEGGGGGGVFRGTYIDDDRKRRSFWERRRAANDPWLWALRDEQVAPSMLVGNDDDDAGVELGAGLITKDTGTTVETTNLEKEEPEGLDGIEDEAKRNTKLFSSVKQ